ncbi:MAG: hypothetical protein Q7R57_07205 [Dehalococcoidales bacterium]|nr:hypothetical protein [Dehalococcoidales bacterium]
MEKVEIKVSKETRRKLSDMAVETGLSTDRLADLLLDEFVEGRGKVYVGDWKEGPGIRVLPDWPRFSSGVVKVKKDDMK